VPSSSVISTVGGRAFFGLSGYTSSRTWVRFFLFSCRILSHLGLLTAEL